jgi:triosephosphate isomerase
MRTPTVVANWKMHTTLDEARRLARDVREGGAEAEAAEGGVRVVLCPPFTALSSVRDVLRGSAVVLGAQDAHWESAGAFTGAVSPAQVADAGATLVILGHSERRQHFGEQDEVVGRKVGAALRHALTPLVCVGETAREHADGRALEVVTRQLRRALGGCQPTEMAGCWLAYEPVWAIGTGLPATPEQAALVHRHLRGLVAELAGRAIADQMPILYGGSVKPDNLALLMADADVDGGLVGGASLKAREFIEIVRAARTARGRVGAPVD